MKFLTTVYNYWFRPWKRMLRQDEFLSLSPCLTESDYVVYCKEFYNKETGLKL